MLNRHQVNEARLMRLIEESDPFVNGLPIAWVDQDEEGFGTFSFEPRPESVRFD